MLYKSKCREFECGCIKIVRDLEAEAAAEALEAQNNYPPSRSLVSSSPTAARINRTPSRDIL